MIFRSTGPLSRTTLSMLGKLLTPRYAPSVKATSNRRTNTHQPTGRRGVTLARGPKHTTRIAGRIG